MDPQGLRPTPEKEPPTDPVGGRPAPQAPPEPPPPDADPAGGGLPRAVEEETRVLDDDPS
jgi:hypothetical protein